MLYFKAGMLLVPGQSVFDAASPEAEKLKTLDYGFIVAALGILFLIIFLTVYIVIKFKAKDNTPEPEQVTGNKKMEYLMVGVPLILVAVFFYWSVKTMGEILPESNNQKPDVVITGHQWWWQANYPASKVVAANEIHLPVGKKLLLKLDAADVIHDWWVPALGGKMDMIPGRDNYLWVTITKPGIYEGACSEFCGQQHAWMRIKVVAQSPQDFQNWLNNNAADTHTPSDKMVGEGKALFMNASCSSCHRIAGTGAAGLQGPDLTHFAGRSTMLAGMLQNNKTNLQKWLTDPQKVKPGAHMPRFIFSADSIHALVAYLSQLK